MKPFGTLLPFEDAKRIIDEHISPISRVEMAGIDDCAGRVLAENITASFDIPSFDRAAMDGYAVKARDTLAAGQARPKVLKLVGELHAGDAARKTVKAGECIQIATGAMMPKGADAVVMVEDTALGNGAVKIFKSVLPGVNVGATGEDIRQGESVLREGIVLNAGKIGVLAAQGIRRVSVYERPVVTILPTGEEVVEVGKKLGKGHVYDINSHTIAAAVRESGAIPVRTKVVGDSADELHSAIAQAAKSDLVVLSGGSSVGERDLLARVLEGWGDILFHGVRLKPGKPTLFAMVDGRPLLGMPGYPTSCLINSYLLLLPAVRKMARLPQHASQTVRGRLSQRVRGGTGRRQFLPVRFENGEVVSTFKESGAITSIASAEGFIEIPENKDFLDEGETVTVTLF